MLEDSVVVTKEALLTVELRTEVHIATQIGLRDVM